MDVARRHLRRLFRRARARRWLVLGIALVAALGATFLRFRTQRAFHAEIVLSVSEDQVEEGKAAPRDGGQLKEAISDVAFSAPNLLPIIKKHGLYRTKLAVDPTLAVEAMKDDIEVEVARNYFLAERSAEDPPRSAIVSVSYRSGDPEDALAVAQDLSQLIVSSQSEARQRMAEVAARETGILAADLRESLLEDRQRINALEKSLPTLVGDERADGLVELMQLRLRREAMERRFREAELMRDELDLHASMERGGLGLHFDLVDTTPPRPPLLPRRYELALLFVFTFLVTLPLASIAVGAFDRRIYDAEDLRAQGFVPLGRLPLAERIHGKLLRT